MIGKVEAAIVVPTGGWDIALNHSSDGAATVTIPAGTYYHSSVGSGSNDLAAELKSQLDGAGAAVYTVTVSAGVGGAGKYTVSVASGTFDFTWTDTELRDALGYDANFTTQTSVTGADQAEGLWLPGGPAIKGYGLASEGKPLSSGDVQVASDGTYYAYHGPKTRRDRLEWRGVQSRYVIAAAEVVTNESFETLWADAIRGEAAWAVAGRSLRYYPDADDDATFFTYHVTNGLEPAVERLDASFDGLWVVVLDVLGTSGA